MSYTRFYGGFDKIKAAVLYVLIRMTTLCFTAALGGSRREAQRVST